MFDDFIAAAVHVEAMSEMSAIFHVGPPAIPSESHNQLKESFREKFFGQRNIGPKARATRPSLQGERGLNM
jgi:hypothetical protein